MIADSKPVAAILAAYGPNSEADKIVGRILEGLNFESKVRPDIRLLSLYTDQIARDDWSGPLAKKHGLLICDTIADAVTCEQDGVPVQGVLCIADGGEYAPGPNGLPADPRRRFFEQVTATLEKHSRPVPIFHSNYLAGNWDDAKWMVDRALELLCPVMCGSAVSFASRIPPLQVRGCEIKEAVVVAPGGLTGNGFHALDLLQSMVEQRCNGERGVRSVCTHTGRAAWRHIRRLFTRSLVEEALESCLQTRRISVEDVCTNNSTAISIDYLGNLRATVVLIDGFQHYGFAFRQGLKAYGCRLDVETTRPFRHYSNLVRQLDRMLQTGHAPHALHRALLTTGMFHAALASQAQQGTELATDHLYIAYDPIPHQPD